MKNAFVLIIYLFTFSAVAGTDYCLSLNTSDSAEMLGSFETSGPPSESRSVSLKDSDGELSISTTQMASYGMFEGQLKLNEELPRSLKVVVSRVTDKGQMKIISSATFNLPNGGNIELYDSKGKSLNIYCGTNDK